MKKNLLFLTLAMLTSLPLMTAEKTQSLMAKAFAKSVDKKDSKAKPAIAYSTDIDHEGSTRNVETLFEETRSLAKRSNLQAFLDDEESEKFAPYLSKTFYDEQCERYGALVVKTQITEVIQEIRQALHKPEIIESLSNKILSMNPSKEIKKEVLKAKKELLKGKCPNKMTMLIDLLNPKDQAGQASPTITVTEEEEEETDFTTTLPMVPLVAAFGASKKHTISPSASPTPRRPRSKSPVSFNPEVAKARYQATPEELAAMHDYGDTRASQTLSRQIRRGAVVEEQSPLANRMQRESIAPLNDEGDRFQGQTELEELAKLVRE